MYIFQSILIENLKPTEGTANLKQSKPFLIFYKKEYFYFQMKNLNFVLVEKKTNYVLANFGYFFFNNLVTVSKE